MAPGGSIAGVMKGLTATAFNPTFSTYTPGNDNVEGRVASIASSDSPLMKQAQQTGLNLANKRGMLNSTVAVGAAQGEVLKAATPIATADAQIAAQKNLAAMDQTGQDERLTADAGFQAQRIAEQGAITGKLNAAQYASQMDQLKTNIAAQVDQLNTQIAASQGAQKADLEAQRDRLVLQGQQQLDQLAAQAGYTSQQMTQQGQITGGLNAAQNQAAMQQLQTQLAGQLQQLDTQIAASQGAQKADLQAQRDRLELQGRQQIEQLAAQAGYTADQMQQQFGYTSTLNQQQAKAQLDQLNVSSAAEMARLQAQLAQADSSQKADIQAQMDRLQVDVKAESDRLAQAAGYDMSRIQAQGQIDIQRDVLAAKNTQDLAKVQADLQSKLQAQGNTEQMQRMNLDLANQIQLQGSQQANDLAKIAASGDQDVRKLVEEANQQRETLAMSLAHDDRASLSQAIVNVFQTENSLRAALLANDKIPAAERAAYETTIANLGEPIRNYLNTMFSAAPTTGGSSYTTEPVGTPSPYTGGLLGGGAPPTDTTGLGGGGAVTGGGGAIANGGDMSNVFASPGSISPSPLGLSPTASGMDGVTTNGGLLAPGGGGSISSPFYSPTDFGQNSFSSPVQDSEDNLSARMALRQQIFSLQ